MLPDPLHPALVHFPIVLALLAPLLAAGLYWAIHTGRMPARAWLAVVVLQAVIFGAAWFTAETGEDEEERVERVIREDPIEEHEEAAEWFIWITALTLPIAAAGILSGSPGTGARALTLVGTLVAAAAVAQVGHTGGKLVYEQGAAIAYLDGPTTAKILGRKAMKKRLSGEGLSVSAAVVAGGVNGMGDGVGDGAAGAGAGGADPGTGASGTEDSGGSGHNQRGRDH